MTQPTPSPPPSKSVLQRLGFATLLMVASVFLSRIVGFAREIIIAAQHGATGNTDAYFKAFTIPDMMNYMLAGGTLSITFIPIFSSYLAKNDEAQGWKLFSTLATSLFILCSVAITVGLIFTPDLVPLVVPGFNAEQTALCVRMTRILLPSLACFTIGGLLQSTLLAREQFKHVAAIPIVYNLCIILGGVGLGPWLGIEGFAWGSLSGAIIGPFLIPLIAARKHITFSPSLDFKHPGFLQYIKLSLPLMLGVTLLSLDDWIIGYFASSFQSSISWLNNARRLMLVPFAIIGQAASQAALPFLSRLWAEDKRDEMADTLTTSLSNVLFFSIIASAAMIALAQPITFAAFQRGAFTPDDATQTATLLAAFSLGITAWSAQALIVRGFYAQKNTLEPMLLGTLVVLIALPIYSALSSTLGPQGLALASSIGIALNASITLAFLRIRHLPIRIKRLFTSTLRGLLCAVPAGLIAFFTSSALHDTLPLSSTPYALLHLTTTGALFGISSILIALAIRAPELTSFTSRIARKLGRQKQKTT